MWEKTKGLEHPHIGLVLTNLGGLYTEMKRFEDAESCLTRALEIGKKVSDDHPLVSGALSGLGSLRLAEGRPADAEPLLRRALEMREAQLEPGHPTIVSTLKELAIVLRETGREAEAAQIDRRLDSI